jgi:hypothetical protein
MLHRTVRRLTLHQSFRCLFATLAVVTCGCSAERPETDTRGVLNLFVSGPLDVRLDGLAYVISGGDAGLLAGALTPNHPVLEMMLTQGQSYSIAVTGLGTRAGGEAAEQLACEDSKHFTIRDLRTTEVDLNLECEAVGAQPPKTTDSSCSVASMLVAPRIQHIGGTIVASAEPFPLEATLRWTTPDDGVGRIFSTGQMDNVEYGFECVRDGFSEIVVEVLSGDCTARAASAVVCMEANELVEDQTR